MWVSQVDQEPACPGLNDSQVGLRTTLAWVIPIGGKSTWQVQPLYS